MLTKVSANNFTLPKTCRNRRTFSYRRGVSRSVQHEGSASSLQGHGGAGVGVVGPGKTPTSAVVWLTLTYRHIGPDISYRKRVLNSWLMTWTNSPCLRQRHPAHPLRLPWDPLNQTVGNCRSRYFVIFLTGKKVEELQLDTIGGISLKKLKGNRVGQACKIDS